MPSYDYSDMVDHFSRLVSSSDWSRLIGGSETVQRQCYECEISISHTFIHEEHELCSECFHRQHVQCISCANMLPRSDVTNSNYYNFVCATCLSEYVPCHICQTRFHPRSGYEIPLVDGTNVLICGGTCESQIRRQCGECGHHHYVPFDRCLTKYPVLPTDYVECYLPNRQFSVELETSKVCPDPKGWTSVTDGSVNGREYLSGPILGKSAIALVESGCASLNEDGPVVDKKCGYHVHLNARDLSEDQVIKFLRLCYKYQNDVVTLVPKSRSFEANRYCAKLPDRFGTNIPLEEMIYPRRDGYEESDHRRYLVESKKYKYYDGRYFWANAHSYYYRGTIEIRLHSGTTLPERVLNWAELWLKLLEYAVNPDTDSVYFGRAGFFTLLERASVRPETIQYYKNRQKKFYGTIEVVEPPTPVVAAPRAVTARRVSNMWVGVNGGAVAPSYYEGIIWTNDDGSFYTPTEQLQ